MFTIQVWTADSVRAARASAQAFAIVDSLNLIFSDYLPESELNALSNTAGSGTPFSVSPALWDILWMSKIGWKKSAGQFDVTVGPLTQLWRQSRKNRQLPSSQILQKAIRTVGMEHLIFNEKEHSVLLKKAGTKLDLGGIGKGYAAQRMLEFMEKAGFPESLCDAAGNMAIGKSPVGGWKVGIESPNQRGELLEHWLTLEHTAISTSGDVYQSVLINGKSYSHLVSPKTGLGVTYQRQVTIVTPDAAKADWLSSACYLLPVSEALKLARAEHAEVLIIDNRTSGIRTYQTEGFKKFVKEE